MVSKIPEHLKKELNSFLQELPQKIVGIRAVVIATADGFEVESLIVDDASGSLRESMAKLAPMTSSLSAIGTVAVQKINTKQKYESITIKSDGGYIFIIEIPHPQYPLIMNLVSTEEALLGQLLYHTKEFVLSVCKI